MVGFSVLGQSALPRCGLHGMQQTTSSASGRRPDHETQHAIHTHTDMRSQRWTFRFHLCMLVARYVQAFTARQLLISEYDVTGDRGDIAQEDYGLNSPLHRSAAGLSGLLMFTTMVQISVLRCCGLQRMPSPNNRCVALQMFALCFFMWVGRYAWHMCSLKQLFTSGSTSASAIYTVLEVRCRIGCWFKSQQKDHGIGSNNIHLFPYLNSSALLFLVTMFLSDLRSRVTCAQPTHTGNM